MPLLKLIGMVLLSFPFFVFLFPLVFLLVSVFFLSLSVNPAPKKVRRPK